MDEFEQLPTGLWVTERSGRFLGANAMACALLGYSRDELLSHTIQDLTHPDDVPERERQVRQAAVGTLFSARRRMRHRDGRWIIVEGRGRMGPDERMLTAVYDVTGVVEAEARLMARERDFRAIFELAASGKAQSDATGRLIRVNRKLCEISGYAEPELLAIGLQDLIHPQDRSLIEAIAGAVQRGERHGWTVELRFVRPTGELRWVIVSGAALRDASGALEKTIATIVDVTERRRAEDQLRASEELYRTVTEVVPDLLWIGAPDGRIDHANARWAAYTGDAPDTIRGQRWLARVHPDDADAVGAAWARAVDGHATYTGEVRFADRRGDYRWFLARAVPVEDEDRVIVRWVGTLTDIDERRRAVEALERADRHKNEFLAVLSHELRNPLAPIRTGVEVLGRLGPPNDQAARTLRIMGRQAAHLSRLVDDLLDVTRISRGKITLRRQVVDLVELVARVGEDHRLAVEGRDLALTVRLAAQPLHAEVDETRIAQVIGNVLHNAAKFTERGGRVELAIRLDGDRAHVTVRDDGVGIPAELLPHVFEPFTQADNSLDRARGGLGLGLALVRALVELHGGEVGADSPGEGGGAEIHVRLPLI